MHIFLSLGTNLGNQEANLVVARDLLMKHDVLVLGQSNVMGEEALVQVVECQTELSPREVLLACKAVEHAMGRPVESANLGNVKLGFGQKRSESSDEELETPCIIDILFYGNWIVKEEGLMIPHVAIQDRSFVLDGLCELSPNFVHPVLKKTLKALRSDA